VFLKFGQYQQGLLHSLSKTMYHIVMGVSSRNRSLAVPAGSVTRWPASSVPTLREPHPQIQQIRKSADLRICRFAPPGSGTRNPDLLNFKSANRQIRGFADLLLRDPGYTTTAKHKNVASDDSYPSARSAQSDQVRGNTHVRPCAGSTFRLPMSTIHDSRNPRPNEGALNIPTQSHSVFTVGAPPLHILRHEAK